MFIKTPPHILPPDRTAYSDDYATYDDFARDVRHHAINLYNDPSTTSAGISSDNHRHMIKLFSNLREKMDRVSDLGESSSGGVPTGVSPGREVVKTSRPPAAPPLPAEFLLVSTRANPQAPRDVVDGAGTRNAQSRELERPETLVNLYA